MTARLSCNEAQERMAAGEVLDQDAQAHVLACGSCTRVAAQWLELDSAVTDAMDGATAVPNGFADRVMSALAAQEGRVSFVDRLLARRSLSLVLANLGLIVAGASLLRFVTAALLPMASLGGSP